MSEQDDERRRMEGLAWLIIAWTMVTLVAIGWAFS